MAAWQRLPLPTRKLAARAREAVACHRRRSSRRSRDRWLPFSRPLHHAQLRLTRLLDTQCARCWPPPSLLCPRTPPQRKAHAGKSGSA